jgi:hypothetical protein
VAPNSVGSDPVDDSFGLILGVVTVDHGRRANGGSHNRSYNDFVIDNDGNPFPNVGSGGLKHLLCSRVIEFYADPEF